MNSYKTRSAPLPRSRPLVERYVSPGVDVAEGEASLDRAIADGEAHGLVKVLTVPGKDRILGVTSLAGTPPSRSVIHALALIFALLWAPPSAAAFDHSHAAWDGLLKKGVVVAPSGVASSVRYAAMQKEHSRLESYLDSLSAVAPEEYRRWTKPLQLAFLINAYNAFTIELILTRYPDLASIKDLGTLLQSPWKKKFFRLLGETRSLDELEHEMIRTPGAFDDPRIHFAVVCASIGCPMLRNEAYTASRLEQQLDDALRRFLSDRDRNRFEPDSSTLKVSRIFDWYRGDFELGHQGFDSLKSLFARHADSLADSDDARTRIRAGNYRLDFLPYDWALNNAR